MELNAEHIALLNMIKDRTDAGGVAPIFRFSKEGRENCAHLLQLGYIGFNFDQDGYLITPKGRKVFDAPELDVAAMRAEIDRLTIALAAAKQALIVHQRRRDNRLLADQTHEGD